MRKVSVLLLETGQEVERVTGSGNPLDPGSAPLAENPLGKLPVLVTDAGQPRFDGRVVRRYRDDRAGQGLCAPAT